MDSRTKLKYCFIIYTLLLGIIIFCVFYFQSYSVYFRYGVPEKNQDPLIVLSVNIDNYYKYSCLLGMITLIRIVKVGVAELTDPILLFTIYNPDKKNIPDFTKNELQFYANYIYLIDSLRYVFTLMITIAQIDLAIFSVIIGEITSFFTIRMLLNKKTFIPEYEEELYNVVPKDNELFI